MINSEDPTIWIAAIKRIWAKDEESRIEEAETLRDCYERKHNWATQMKDRVEKMITWTDNMNVNYRLLGKGKILVYKEIKIMGKIQNKHKPKSYLNINTLRAIYIKLVYAPDACIC